MVKEIRATLMRRRHEPVAIGVKWLNRVQQRILALAPNRQATQIRAQINLMAAM